MDRIAEKYEGALGSDYETKISRARIHWMVEMAKGPRVLDWGCGQGIATSLLAARGFSSIGYDVDEDAIAYARAHYPAISFTTNVSDLGTGYDAILIGEVLEHQENPAKFLEQVSARLAPLGRIVATVPHGWNDVLDHRQFFTMTTFLELVTPLLSVVHLAFVDGFIRFAGTKEPTAWTLTREIERQAEDDLLAFYLREKARTAELERALMRQQEVQARVERELEELRGNPVLRVLDQIARRSATRKDG